MTTGEIQIQDTQQEYLRTTTGEFLLNDYRLQMAGQTWSILHTDAILTSEDETRFLREQIGLLPYGVALWPAAIALAHDIISRGEALRDRRVLELGAGTGLPGIAAASLGAHVAQTDRHEVAMSVCKRNGLRNGINTIEYRLVDWSDWGDTAQYDWILGSDILYREALHPHLQNIFESNLAPGGRILLSDPFRRPSLTFLEQLDEGGWTVSVSTWSVGEKDAPRSIGLFELARR